MATIPPGAAGSAGSPEAWDQLSVLNRLIVSRTLPAAPVGEQPPGSLPGAPPTALALTAEIDSARGEFSTFTSHATELEAAISRGEVVSDAQIGGALDNARAWVEYFGPQGPLCRGFPASTPPAVYVDAMARVGQLQRLAQQWADYFAPLLEQRSSSSQALARDEHECLQRAAEAEQAVGQRQMSFTLNSASLSSDQMQGYIQELNDLLAKVQGWQAQARGPACAQRLEALIGKITSVLRTFSYSCNSRRTFEGFQRQQGWLPPAGGGLPAGRPGPGSPEWYTAITGMNCYWCGQDLRGFPQPVAICPRCHRFPQPGPM